MKASQPAQCGTCIFRDDGRGVVLRPDRIAEIEGYLILGTVHLCHTDERLACRGGRDFQLRVWAAAGVIPEPTDAALVAAMRAAGVDPDAGDR